MGRAAIPYEATSQEAHSQDGLNQTTGDNKRIKGRVIRHVKNDTSS